MESLKAIMENLGFKEGADDSVKAAFVQNLIFQAYGVRAQIPAKYKPSENKKRQLSEQLAFDLEDAG